MRRFYLLLWDWSSAISDWFADRYYGTFENEAYMWLADGRFIDQDTPDTTSIDPATHKVVRLD